MQINKSLGMLSISFTKSIKCENFIVPYHEESSTEGSTSDLWQAETMTKLFLLAFLLTVCTLSSASYGPVDKPGVCPSNGQSMGLPCFSDRDCPGIEKCCSHGYGGKRFCTIPERPGYCPIAKGGGICIQECYNDFDCPPPHKCCFNGCGYVCTWPVYGKGY